MMEIAVFVGGVLFISFIIGLYIRSVAKEFFRLKRVLDENKDAIIEYVKQFTPIESKDDKDEDGEKAEDVAYMKAYV